MMNNNFNNGATNNNSNNGKGDFIMATNTIGTMEVFAGTIKSAMEAYFGEGVRVTVQKVTKNNGMILTGLTIMDKTSNLAPTIYLEGYFNDYNCGEPMSDICQRILKVYEENKVTDNFDISMVTNFGRARNRICCKLINVERNAELLADAPHVIIEDLAVIFFILATRDEFGTGTITIRNNILDMWDITVDQLYKLALENTQRLFRGKVASMLNVMTEILADKLDEESCSEFFDMMVDDMTIPMFVASNTAKLNGAIVMLYDNLMKKFAEKIGGSFYILPSSVHEALFIPCSDDMDVEYLRDMVRTVNATEVSEEEYLSDNVYRYDADTDSFEIA